MTPLERLRADVVAMQRQRLARSESAHAATGREVERARMALQAALVDAAPDDTDHEGGRPCIPSPPPAP